MLQDRRKTPSNDAAENTYKTSESTSFSAVSRRKLRCQQFIMRFLIVLVLVSTLLVSTGMSDRLVEPVQQTVDRIYTRDPKDITITVSIPNFTSKTFLNFLTNTVTLGGITKLIG
ncbi:hypothetical protein FHG87_003030 [Trinorchestia longiramus]|nr:hypothetical protein FHG87_003030 [Trinorchestia longiramus]